MIDIKVSVRGEIDTPPLVRVFQYPDKDEESIFFSAIASIKKKIGMGLKVNANESLAIFCAYVIEQMREHKSLDQIEIGAQDILSSDQVMIGVPETLREMSFDVIVDDLPEQRIKFNEPMKISNYMMT
ncbi:MAG TPA: urease subunit gamma [Nitrososphaeraceae archaeon]|jgi:urease subunit gamma|nr:urease subunit gamma [Nitrososphaeraceae archaeon]